MARLSTITSAPASPARLWRWAIAAVLLVATFIARAPALGPRSFWIDEFVTWDVAGFPFWRAGSLTAGKLDRHSMFAFAVNDTGPGPLMYLLEGLFAGFVKPYGGEGWLRLPGVLAGMATVALLLWRGVRWTGGRDGALVMAAFAALHSHWIEASGGARGYGWLLLLTTLQAGLTIELTTGRGFVGWRQVWLVWCAAATAGVGINPLHGLVAGALAGPVLVERWRRRSFSAGGRDSVVAEMPASWFWGAAGAAALVSGGYMAFWYWRISHGASASIAGTRVIRRSMAPAELASRFAEQVAGSPDVAWLLGSGVVAAVIAWCFKSRGGTGPAGRRAAAVAAIGLWLAPATVVLVLGLLRGHFLVGRYFYALAVLTCLCMGLAMQRLAGALAGPRRTEMRRMLWAAVACAALVSVPAGWRLSSTPIHDWAAAVSRLKSISVPGDAVLVGPNADQECFRFYAKAAGLPFDATETYYDAAGTVRDARTYPGLKILLEQSDKRIFFVTPFLRAVRTPAYWSLAERSFTPVADIPGRGAIAIRVRNPPAASSETSSTL